MKRHPALAELSRDHHHALVVARTLRQATPGRTARAANAFLSFWNADGQAHFRLEEDVLLPTYARHGRPDEPAIVRMLIEHMIIRRDAELVAAGASVSTLQQLGVVLAAHVRLEERQVFPLVEQALSATELDVLAARLAAGA